MDVEKFDTVVLDLSWYWYWSRVKVTLAKSQLGCGCAAVEQWYFSEASGLVLELLEAEPAGTARHRTRQPGEISRPSSRQKHGRIPIIPGPLTRKYMEASLQAFFQFIIFQAKRKDPFQGSVRPLSRQKHGTISYCMLQFQLFQAFFQAKPRKDPLQFQIFQAFFQVKRKGSL